MILRATESRDTAALAELNGQLGYPTTPEEMAHRLATLDDHEAVFVAEVDGRCVGWVQVGMVVSLETGKFAEIRGLVVDATRRGAGIGAALVAKAEEWAGRHACDRVRVRSNIFRDRTHAFYERLGYTLVKSQKVFDKR